MGKSNLFRHKLKSIKVALTLSVFLVGLFDFVSATFDCKQKALPLHSYRKRLVFNIGGYDF